MRVKGRTDWAQRQKTGLGRRSCGQMALDVMGTVCFEEGKRQDSLTQHYQRQAEPCAAAWRWHRHAACDGEIMGRREARMIGMDNSLSELNKRYAAEHPYPISFSCPGSALP